MQVMGIAIKAWNYVITFFLNTDASSFQHWDIDGTQA